MANIASDAFGGTSGDALSTYDANWTASSGTTGDGTISDAGRVRGATTSVVARYRDDVTPSSADYSVSCDLYIASTLSNRAGVSARQSSSANTRYFARYNRLTAGVELFKTVSGTSTQLGSTSSQTASAGSTYRLELVVNGTTIEAYWDGGGIPVVSQTDSAISAAGHPGIVFLNGSVAGNTSGIHIDNWSVDTLGGAATDLTVAEASHGHSADSLTLSIGVSLAIDDATHGHAADAITLTTASTLAVADALHAHAADQVTLTLAGSELLTIADATHAHTADAPVLSVDSLLAVDDAMHAHSADNVVLGVTGVADLIIADATHAHSVDGLVLTSESLLAIQDALHAHAADALTLDSAPTLLIADALHAHTSDGLLLTVDAWLVIADALHGHTADSITLGDSGAVVLIVADAVHAHAADTLRLFYEVWAATKAPIGARYASGARAARLSTTARQPRLSTRTR